MSDPLDRPRDAAIIMMVGARRTAMEALQGTADTALGRAKEALQAAKTQFEIERIRDVYISSVVNLGGTSFVTRSP